MLAKNFPNVPIFNDVKELASDPTKFIQQPIGILSGGYPCQPFSTSGKRLGSEDPRHIFPYIHEIVKQIRPSYCVFENVYGHVSMGLDEVLFAMENLNYQTRTHLLFRLQVSERDTNETECGSSVKTWATPTTMDYLPPRSAEATKRLQEGARKGRKRPSNLREQVDPKTMEMYPTPTTKGFGHASEGQTMIFRKKVEGRTDRDRSSIYDEWGNFKTTEDGRVEVSDSEQWSSETFVQWQQSVLRKAIERWETDRPHNEDVSNGGRCETQLRLDRVANGVSYWMDEPRGIPRITTEQQNRPQRLKMLGNAIVPQHAYHIGLAIKEDIKNG